jgi:hypothetical protein
MKLIASIMALLLFSGCTTFRPIESQQLHEKLSAGEVIQVKDEVKIHTSDGMNHSFKINAMSEGRIMGTDENVPIEDIVSIEKREFSTGKTVLLIGVGIVGIVLVLGSIAAAQASLASGL